MALAVHGHQHGIERDVVGAVVAVATGALDVVNHDRLFGRRVRFAGEREHEVVAQVVDALAVRPHLERAAVPARQRARRADRRMREVRLEVLGLEAPRSLVILATAVSPRCAGTVVSCGAVPRNAGRSWASGKASAARHCNRLRKRSATASASRSRDATTATKLPSAQQRTPARSVPSAGGGQLTSLAPSTGPRSTRPCSMLGSRRSWMKRAQPNTLSARSTRAGRARPNRRRTSGALGKAAPLHSMSRSMPSSSDQ